MRQILQSLRNGTTEVIDVPQPGAGRGQLLIQTSRSLISAGTERMLLDFGKAGWLDKARQQPDKVQMVIGKIKTDGIAATLESVQAKLDSPITLGYSNVGRVLEVGSGVAGFRPLGRVASNGPHAEVVRVPQNLCAIVPECVSDEEASFTIVASIALEGIRLAAPSLGESFVVTGLGLIGLITVQLLRAHGCRVLGIDFDAAKLRLAEQFGAEAVNLGVEEDPLAAAERFSRGRGVDGVLITAATKSNEPVHQAALMSRKRGRLILVGVTGLELSRDDFYKKELSLQVACSYGPGRYDAKYEEQGADYPFAYVRWTAQRNFEAVLDMMADGRLNVQPLITHRFAFERATDAYELLCSKEFHLGIVLEYPSQNLDQPLPRAIQLRDSTQPSSSSRAAVGFIGAGGYASKVLLRAFQKSGAQLVSIASAGGVTATVAGRKFGFQQATTDLDSILSNPGIDLIAISTRHDSHADLVCRALNAGKHVFVEKPLALSADQLDEIERTIDSIPAPGLVMVGFNRRFAPHTVRARELLKSVKGPKSLIYTVNAGAIPLEHWTQDPQTGGGRILGEVCHFIDLLRFLVDFPAKEVKTTRQSSDTVTISIAYEDGSIGTIHYFATGHRAFPKERIEIFAEGRIVVIDNFRKMQAHGWPAFKRMSLWRQDKGANDMVAAFVKSVRSGATSPIPLNELIEVTRTTLQAASL